MPVICMVDERGRFTGQSRTIEDDEGCPVGWVFADPPEPAEGAIWDGLGWRYRTADDAAAELLAERKAGLRAAVDALAAEKMATGYPHDFGAPYGVQVLQNRDADDRTNWLSVAATANLLIATGRAGDPCGALRTEANVNVPVTATQAAATLVAMQAYLSGFLARAWALKDQIRDAADADLDAIDITAGWPGQEAA